MNVIFKRPVRLGKVSYPKAKRSVEIDDVWMKSKFVQALVKSGEIVIPPQAAAAPKAAVAEKAPAPAAKAAK